MRALKIILPLIIFASIYGQEREYTNIPCKPISEMAAHYDRLAKAAQRVDIFDYDVNYYDIDIEVDIDAELIYGFVEVHILPVVGDLESIQLDFVSGMTVDSVYLNGATFNHFSDILSITLDGSYSVGEALAVGIQYHGHPVENGFQAFKFGYQFNNSQQAPMISTLSEPYGARTWWPCKDVPTDKADSVRIAITVDEDYQAVANGLLTSETSHPNGTKTWVWEHKYPITPYLVSLAITDYTYWNDMHHFADGDSMLLEYWMYPASATSSNMDRWNRTSDMMSIFSEYFGKYPFAEEKYGMAQFEWGGAMEHQTCSSMGSSGENTIAHELAHQWWGDLVTCSNFHHIWINEGFATYSEALYWGAVYGEDAYHAHMASKMNTSNSSVYRPDTSSVGAIFSTSMVYQKGAWVLHMLRNVVGDETFFDGLLAYRDAFQFSHASTEDFQGVMETVADQDLEWFFDQWIYGSGRPTYRWWWSASEPDNLGNSQILVHVDQIQDSSFPTFKMPIDINMTNGTDTLEMVIWDSLRIQEFTLESSFIPNDLTLDGGNWIFKSANQVAGVFSGQQPGAFKLLPAYPNPFNAEIRIPYITTANFQGEISIYDLRGAEVFSKTLSHQHSSQYEISWDGTDTHGQSLSSGIYIARITSVNYGSVSQKISILK